jgi:hypothetical protein
MSYNINSFDQTEGNKIHKSDPIQNIYIHIHMKYKKETFTSKILPSQ